MTYSAEDARRLVLWLIVIESVMAAVYLLTTVVAPTLRYGPLRAWFDVAGELSIPTWFSTVQLFSVGLVLLLAAQRNDEEESRLPSWSFVVAGGVFFFLSADEGAVIHERLTGVMADLGVTWLLFEGDHGGWVAIYGLFALLVLFAARRWVVALWNGFRRESLFALAGAAVYVTGAVAVEILGYFLGAERGETAGWGAVRFAVEEFFEMSGVSVLLYAALLLALRVQRETA